MTGSKKSTWGVFSRSTQTHRLFIGVESQPKDKSDRWGGGAAGPAFSGVPDALRTDFLDRFGPRLCGPAPLER